MTESTNTPKIHRTCKLGKIKECDVSFDTNIKTKLFCCDSHRYKWHNNLRSLFRRMVKIENNQEKIIELLNDHVGFRIKENGEMFYPVKEAMK